MVCPDRIKIHIPEASSSKVKNYFSKRSSQARDESMHKLSSNWVDDTANQAKLLCPCRASSKAMLADLFKCGAILDPFVGPTWGQLTPIMCNLGASLGTYWARLWAILGPFWALLVHMVTHLYIRHEKAFQVHTCTQTIKCADSPCLIA